MAVYADKRNGKPTGRWVVEVKVLGKKHLKRFDTIEEAYSHEAVLKGQRSLTGAAGPAAGPTAHGTARMRLSDSLSGFCDIIWNGKTNRATAEAHLKAISNILSNPVLDTLDTNALDKVMMELKARGKSDATINRYLTHLNRYLKAMHVRGNRKDPPPAIEWRDEDEGRIRIITPAEEAALVALMHSYGEPDLARLVEVALDTGCRRGELLDIDEDQLRDGWLMLWQTKAKVPRAVPLTLRAQNHLEAMVPFRYPSHSVRYYWDKARAALGLEDDPEFVFHALRHTCATRLVEANVNLRVIQRYMGHLSIETTLRYAKCSDDLLKAAADTLEKANVSLEGPVPHRRDPTGNRGSERKVVTASKWKTEENQEDKHAAVAELVDALDLGSSGSR